MMLDAVNVMVNLKQLHFYGSNLCSDQLTGQVVDLKWLYLVVGHFYYINIKTINVIIPQHSSYRLGWI